MIEVGFKDKTVGAEALVDLTVIRRGGLPPVMPRSRPAQMPRLPEGHVLFGTRNQGFGDVLYLCETLEDAQYLWDSQDSALASPVWYSAPVLSARDN